MILSLIMLPDKRVFLKYIAIFFSCYSICFFPPTARFFHCLQKRQSLQNKREFDERARENNYDLLYKNECQNWHNKINKAKRTTGFPADRLEETLTAFEAFKNESLQRKRAVKERTASPKEFTDWLYQQSNVIENLTKYS